jgi:wyosine [tRNA(Phe)-imidazoG37] synthetase (radical SAM superfamily)
MSKMQASPGFRQYFRQPEEWNDPTYVEYRRLWTAAPVEGISLPYPLNLDLEVTNCCNLRCPFCIRETGVGKEGFMDMETYFSIMEEIGGHLGFNGKLIPAKVGAIKLNWRGEPTLHPDLVDMVGMAKAMLIPEVSINTNGTKLTPVLSKKLIEARIDRIIISVDSIDPVLYESQRVGAKLEPVLKNIESLIKLRDTLSYNGRPYVRVQKVDLPEGRLENEEYVDFFLKMGCDSVAINSYKSKALDGQEWEANPCAMPFQRLICTWDGYFYPCCEGNRFKPIGNIHDMSIETAWLSPLMNRLRKAHSTGQQNTIDACKRCGVTCPAED